MEVSGAVDGAEEAHAIGYALWRVRDKRRLSLRVVAGLAGMSKDSLNRIERGELSPTLNQIHALAEALQTSASELTRLPFPAPANGHTDSAIEAIRRALDAIDVGHPGGMVLPLTVLRDRVERAHAQFRACRFAELATALAGPRGLSPLAALPPDIHPPATGPLAVFPHRPPRADRATGAPSCSPVAGRPFPRDLPTPRRRDSFSAGVLTQLPTTRAR